MAGQLSRLVVAASLVLVSACTDAASSSPPTPPPAPAPESAALAASREFQDGYEQLLRGDPTSFLTTVAAYYLASGDTLALLRSDLGWTEAPADAAPELEIVATAGALSIRRASELHRFEAGASFVVDERYTLSLSRQELDWRVLVHDRDAPRRTQFPGLEWFPLAARFIVEARYEPKPSREPMLLQTSRGVQKTLYVAGVAEFELAGASASLLVFAYAATPSPDEPMLIPFRDASSGKTSYAAGRYLELEAPRGASLVLDFNRATNPLCAYSEHYNCPMPPRFNTLAQAIEAGARAPH